MNGELKMENGELKTSASMRDALLDVADAAKRDWLDMPGGFRLSRFHVAGRSTFVGLRKNKGDNGGNIYVVEVRRGKDCESAFFKFTKNGERLCDGFFFFGSARAQEQAAVGLLHGYLARIEKDRQHHKRNRQNRKARKAAAETVTPIDPPLAVPPRPGLPEDDE